MIAPFDRAPAADAAWHVAVCRQKKRWLTRAYAKRIAKAARARFGRVFDVYECPVCAGFHLRSRRPPRCRSY